MKPSKVGQPGVDDELDALDWKIIEALRLDGRLSNAALAERIDSSGSQCSRRRQRLEQVGVISSYRAQLDAQLLGFDVATFVHVSLASHTDAARANFTRLVATHRSIQSCHSVTGGCDYILRVVARNLAALNQLVLLILETQPGTKVQSMVVLESLKDEVCIV